MMMIMMMGVKGVKLSQVYWVSENVRGGGWGGVCTRFLFDDDGAVQYGN